MLQKDRQRRPRGAATSAGSEAGSHFPRGVPRPGQRQLRGAPRAQRRPRRARPVGSVPIPTATSRYRWYVVDGALTHADSMGNEHKLTRGEVQYMSAGKGVLHSEYNRGDTTLRFLQICFPDEKGHEPDYGDHRFPWEARKNAWLLIASGPDGDAPVTIHQDVRQRRGARSRPGARLRRRPRPAGLSAAESRARPASTTWSWTSAMLSRSWRRTSWSSPRRRPTCS